jgi:hypothetical protein
MSDIWHCWRDDLYDKLKTKYLRETKSAGLLILHFLLYGANCILYVIILIIFIEKHIKIDGMEMIRVLWKREKC